VLAGRQRQAAAPVLGGIVQAVEADDRRAINDQRAAIARMQREGVQTVRGRRDVPLKFSCQPLMPLTPVTANGYKNVPR
jgi:hypothetical protein